MIYSNNKQGNKMEPTEELIVEFSFAKNIDQTQSNMNEHMADLVSGETSPENARDNIRQCLVDWIDVSITQYGFRAEMYCNEVIVYNAEPDSDIIIRWSEGDKLLAIAKADSAECIRKILKN